MQTQRHYEALAEQVRKQILDKKAIPLDYQEVIEEFLPIEEKFPDRRVITLYEYPDSNPENFLENKRGFRLQFALVFLSNEQSAGFYQEVMNNAALKWQIARFYLEVAENVVFVKTRGQTIQNMLQKLDGCIVNQPLCIFHFNLKMRTILHIIEKGYWCIRIVWGPAQSFPLYGQEDENENIKDQKFQFPKLEIAVQQKKVNDNLIKTNTKVEEQNFKMINKAILQSADYYSKLAESTVVKLRQQNKQEQEDQINRQFYNN